MKYYELTYLIKADLTEEKAKALQEKIISLVQEEGGILNEANSPLKRKLAYPIKKEGQAYLATLKFQLKPDRLVSLEKKIESEKEILRYLILTKKKAEVVPEAVKAIPVSRKGEKAPSIPSVKQAPKKVELKEIEKKLEEILKE
jgi:ribosomal protein S6